MAFQAGSNPKPSVGGAHGLAHSFPNPIAPHHTSRAASHAAAPGLASSLSHSTLASTFVRHGEPQLTAHQSTAQYVEPRDRLTFFQRHFTKPVDKDPEKTNKSSNRRFAFLSLGSITCGILMLLILFGAAAAAIAVTVDHRTRQPALQATNRTSPIRAAIYDNFPDPALWYSNGTYYAFATNNAAGIIEAPTNHTTYDYGTSNVQLATSPDFLNWTLEKSVHDPLPSTGVWTPQGLTEASPRIPRANVWAPAIIQRPTDGKYVMYYSANRVDAQNPSPNHPPPHCIGAAVSKTDGPAGPYEPLKDTLACPVDEGGAIDPAAFQDHDGTLYVAYKVDGNNIGHGGLCGNTKAPIVPTPIKLQKMHPDGVTKDGNATIIMDRLKIDGPLVEAPSLIRSHEGIYFLFFSSGCTRSPTYDVKYATSKSVTGPYKRANGPLLQTGDWGLLAPGSVSVHEDINGGFMMAFHARVTAPQGRIRAMFTTKLKFTGNVVQMVSDDSDDDG